VTKPGLESRDGAAVFSRQGLLEVNDLRLKMTEDVNMAIGRGERENHGLLLNQSQSLRVNRVEPRASRRPERLVGFHINRVTTYIGFFTSSPGV
jgi:hypothetical protein